MLGIYGRGYSNRHIFLKCSFKCEIPELILPMCFNHTGSSARLRFPQKFYLFRSSCIILDLLLADILINFNCTYFRQAVEHVNKIIFNNKTSLAASPESLNTTS